MKCYVDMPYPSIMVQKRDVELAKKILNVYAGEVSEDTSTHTYIFQSLISQNEEIKKILKDIGIVEMHHLEMLGLLIKKLGLLPIYISENNNNLKWFNGKYVNYERNLKKLIRDNIEMEKKAIRNYDEIIKETDDNYVIHLIKRIILDERLHIEIFEKIYQQLDF